MRPYHPSSFHFNWRYWWDFGGGTLGDFGCHYMDLPFWALDLRYPTTVEAKGEKTIAGDNDVPDNMRVDYHFPARGEQPAVHLTWYHGDWQPDRAPKCTTRLRPCCSRGARRRLLADYGTQQAVHERRQPSPAARRRRFPTRSAIGAEWAEACKTRGPTTCNFDYSGALAEAVLLGNVSYRAGSQKLAWDAEACGPRIASEADQFIQPRVSPGLDAVVALARNYGCTGAVGRAMVVRSVRMTHDDLLRGFAAAACMRILAERRFPPQWLAAVLATEPLRHATADLSIADGAEARLRDDLRVFIAEKNWEGCGGLTVTDEMKVTIAAQACLMALGLPGEPFRRRAVDSDLSVRLCRARRAAGERAGRSRAKGRLGERGIAGR